MTSVTVEPFLVNSLVALFDDDLPPPLTGDQLPPYWHLAACAVPVPTRLIGPDGHPTAASVTAPPGLPRRMVAGGSLAINDQVGVGETLEQLDTIVESRQTQGRSGLLQFVTVQSEFRRADGTTPMVERRAFVYREAAATKNAPSDAEPRPPGPLLRFDAEAVGAELWPDPVSLLRFSALTSNAHRIHYDDPYATTVEGYPGLVVHGPLLLLSMLELVRRFHPGSLIATVAFTAKRPVFVNEPVQLSARESDGNRLELCATTHGDIAMSAQVELVS